MVLRVKSTFRLPVVGLYTWNIAENSLVADEVYSELYGLNPDKLARGMEIEEIISLVFIGDRERAARATHQAILSGKIGTIDYRITVGGALRNVSAYGRCLKDKDGIPSLFTGGVAADLSFSLTAES